MEVQHSGDGKTKESAIYFTNANTFVDHIEMQQLYLKQRNIETNTTRNIGEVNDKYMYDVYETKKGNLWFKVPNNLIE